MVDDLEQARAAQKHSDARYALKGGLLQMLGVMGNGLMAVHHILVARLFGQGTYGLYSGTLLIIEIASRFCCLGADKGLFRFVAGHRATGESIGEQRAVGTGLRNTLIVSCLFVVVAFVGSGWLGRWRQEPWLEQTLPYMSLGALGTAVMLVLVAAALGRRVPRVSLAVRGVAEPGFLVLSTVVVGLLWPTVSALALSFGLAYLATATVAALLVRGVFGPGYIREAVRLPSHRPFVKFSLTVAVLELVNMLRQRLDGLIVFAFFSHEMAALYLASEFIGRVAASIRYAFDGISGPMFAESLALVDRDRLQANLQVLTRWVLTLSLPLTSSLIVFREDLLFLSGEAFTAASTLVLFHVSGNLINGVFGMCGGVLVMSGRPRLLMINQITAGVVNVLACYLLIPRFGLTGAATAFVLSYIVVSGAAIIQVWFYERVHPFSTALFKPLMAAVVAYLCQVGVAMHIEHRLLRMVSVLMVGFAVHLLVLLALRLAPEEQVAVRTLMRRLKRTDS